ncbi:LytTR family DNA-binding domain-containing protein [Elizabethkingia sp. JS20170427COW]|uniref:LytR/AlgR family response regulator transcription factor n=1 Tax=Elizabethkingia sp. JS20170427COW TaxID=2583851 RepID=UPI001110D333|nr:LytTR family DNA-binding domain-containing protein [Elizabethkingia sp. JS20170427COW]QCX52488.1 response regulator transcription factor [Elizabethkingia sp. JS20170427COW]
MKDHLRCIVIDDEPIGRGIIENFVKQVPFLDLSSSFGDPLQAMTYLQNNKTDIVFSDIEMPNLNGIELINSLANPPMVIFITAHRDFALDGFDTGAMDYLVKPVRFDRFLKAVNRAKDYLSQTTKVQQEAKTPDRIFIKSDGKLVKIILEDIIYIEAQDDYLKIVTNTETYTTLATLKSMEEVLIPPVFFRLQRSFIVKISEIKALNGNMIELHTGKSISVASAKKEELYNLLGIK